MSTIICQEFADDNPIPQDSKNPHHHHPISFFQDPPLVKDNADSSGGGGGKGEVEGWSSLLLAVENSNAAHQNRHMTVGAVETEQQKQQQQEVYVHPLVKRSSSNLSTKSLEMCTESLGSETGSDEIIEDLSIEKQGLFLRYRKSKKISRDFYGDFPPPLTSITGFETTRVVKSLSECGRLVLKAISCSNSSFQTERVNGRLKLYSVIMKVDDFEQSENAVEEDEDGDEDVALDVDSMRIEEKMEEIEDEKFVEMDEFIRTRNFCKETGSRKTGSINWDPYCVAIS